jgi:hypothetical protein
MEKTTTEEMMEVRKSMEETKAESQWILLWNLL